MANIKTSARQFLQNFKETVPRWWDRDPFNNSVVIAYYTIFSLPGLLVIIINIAGFFYDKDKFTTQLTEQIQQVVGGDTAKDVQSIVGKASESKGTVISSVLGILTLLFGATGVFYQVQQMLNKIWEVKPKPKTKQKILRLLRDRLFSFGMILGIGFLLLVSLVLSAAVAALNQWVSSWSEALVVLLKFSDVIVSLLVITVLFAAIFKFLPDIKITWKEVLPGALLTAVLFVLAKFALGLYFGTSNPGSAYGAAGSIILIMLWVSYAGLILLFGAEFTRVHTEAKGKKVEPSSLARPDDTNTKDTATDQKKTN